MDPLSPATRRLLDAALVLGPLCYLGLDAVYTVRGWWDGPTGAAHVLLAALYGLTALALVVRARGRLQAVLLAVTVLGVVGNAGVGVDTVQVALGGVDLFREGGPAVVFKALGFFFPLTLLLAAVALRSVTPRWWPPLLGLGALVFPVAHVANIGWLALLDGVLLLVALGSMPRIQREDATAGVPAGVALPVA